MDSSFSSPVVGEEKICLIHFVPVRKARQNVRTLSVNCSVRTRVILVTIFFLVEINRIAIIFLDSRHETNDNDQNADDENKNSRRREHLEKEKMV